MQPLIDHVLMKDGFAACLELFRRPDRDFVTVSLGLADVIEKPLQTLQPYLRMWYSSVRDGLADEGADVSGASSDDEVREAAGWLARWSPPTLKPDATEDNAAANSEAQDELRRLMGVALTMPTSDAVMAFVDFTSKLKRLGPYNMMMVYTQRPGASAVASRKDREAVGQTVRGDAIPILILKPKGPITQVFELADTEPPQERDPRADPLGGTEDFQEARLVKFVDKLTRPTKRELKVEVLLKDFGSNLAGRSTRFGIGPQAPYDADVAAADAHAVVETISRTVYTVSLNRRLTPLEQFVTLLHELGHLFCGHLGAFGADNPVADEYGWPDRHHLPPAAREIEAELVAWQICDRENLVVGAPLYLKGYMEQHPDEVAKVDLDRVVRAIARVKAYLGYPEAAATARPAPAKEHA